MGRAETACADRFALWTEHTERGTTKRSSFDRRSTAVEDAKKYWLTAVGLFRVFVRDTEDESIVFERRFAHPEPR